MIAMKKDVVMNRKEERDNLSTYLKQNYDSKQQQ